MQSLRPGGGDDSWLGAFDLFVSGDADGPEWISAQLDRIAADFAAAERAEVGEAEQGAVRRGQGYSCLAAGGDGGNGTPRRRALRLAAFLRRAGLVGIAADAGYHRLQHSLLGAALREPPHNSLPLVSAAIYCAVARRAGLVAHPCGFPFHVHVVVAAPGRYDLDGRPVGGVSAGHGDGDGGDDDDDDDSSRPVMYLDPFHSADEVPLADLRAQLHALAAEQRFLHPHVRRRYGLGSPASSPLPGGGGGGGAIDEARFLAPLSTAETVLRCARNIRSAVPAAAAAAGGRRSLNDRNPDGSILHAHADADADDAADAARAAALWALVLLAPWNPRFAPHDYSDPAHQHQQAVMEGYVSDLAGAIFRSPADVYLFERHVLPLVKGTPHHADLSQTMAAVRQRARRCTDVHARTWTKR
ncbi:hypothetical protein KEM52_002895 [Ascosphaera acerosa]|nr:hypothetical protein KEM52_002895 [Ascosphaera acerosa]